MALKRNKIQQESEAWFRNLLKKNSGIKAGEDYTKGNNKSLGTSNMFQFSYKNPVTPLKQLKIFDENPLIVLFNKRGNDMYGINLHFIPKPLKETFLKLVIQMNKQNIKKDKRLTIEYKQMKQFLKRNGLDIISVKRYKINRITNFKYIPYRDWRYALNLPTEKFVRHKDFSKDDLEKMLRGAISRARQSKNKRFGR